MPAFVGVRTQRYKLVSYLVGKPELYDLASDPYEIHNVIGTADPRLVGGLEERIDQIVECVGHACRDVEDAPIPAEILEPAPGA